MAIRVRTAYTSGSTLAYSVERLSDGLLFDFGDSTFKSTPGTATASVAEGAGIYLGRYSATLASTPTGQFPDGNYAVYLHESGVTIASFGVQMVNGDDVALPGDVTGAADWTADEKAQIRRALGVTGTQAATGSGDLATIAASVSGIAAAVWAYLISGKAAGHLLGWIAAESVGNRANASAGSSGSYHAAGAADDELIAFTADETTRAVTLTNPTLGS